MANLTLKLGLLATALTTVLLTGCNQSSNAQTGAPASGTATAITTTTTTDNASMVENEYSDIARALQENIQKSGIGIQVLSVAPTDIPDMYWATLKDAPSVFTDKTGSYVFQGEVVKIGDSTPVNISEKMKSATAKTVLGAVDKSEMIIFPAKGETKAIIYVFSDPTCSYCQKLHSEIKDTNARGIEVRYLAWPRGDDLTPLSEAVWCSKDRQDAITRAKRGEKIAPATCDNPVAKHVRLGYSLGVSGTPAIFAANGVQLGGYLPSAELVKQAIANK